MTHRSLIVSVLTLLFLAPADASSNCIRMKSSDYLAFYGRRQHADRFVECVVGRWPNVHTAIRRFRRR